MSNKAVIVGSAEWEDKIRNKCEDCGGDGCDSCSMAICAALPKPILRRRDAQNKIGPAKSVTVCTKEDSPPTRRKRKRENDDLKFTIKLFNKRERFKGINYQRIRARRRRERKLRKFARSLWPLHKMVQRTKRGYGEDAQLSDTSPCSVSDNTTDAEWSGRELEVMEAAVRACPVDKPLAQALKEARFGSRARELK